MDGFTIINNDIFRDKNLTMQERYFLIILKTFDYKNDGKVFPTYERLMKYSGINKRGNISKITKSLKDKNYISISKKGRVNAYNFIKNYLLSDKNKEEKDTNNSSHQGTDESNTSTYGGTNTSSYEGTDERGISTHGGTNTSSYEGTDERDISTYGGTNSSSYEGTDKRDTSTNGRTNNSTHVGTDESNTSTYRGTNNSTHEGTDESNTSTYGGANNSTHVGTDKRDTSTYGGTNTSSYEGTDERGISTNGGTSISTDEGTSTSSHGDTVKIKDKNTKEKYINIFNYWNDTNIYKENCLNTKISNSITMALRKYTLEEIITAIKNYKEVYFSDYYYDYTWSLQNFLVRENALKKFLSEGEIWTNYKSTTNKPEKKETFNLSDLID